MKPNSTPMLSNRVLKINVGFLLSDGPGNNHDSRFDIPDPVRVADDLNVNYIHGDIRLSRSKEGILVQAELHVGVRNQCSRCLEEFDQDLTINIEELYAYPRPIGASEFWIGQDTVLDLGPLVRAEALIQMSAKSLCSPGCKGLCPECGANRNTDACRCDVDRIDPRLAKLKELLDPNE